MCYVREGPLLFQQWYDRRTVTMLSTYHKGDDFVLISRNARQNGQHVEVIMKQPESIAHYNHGMGGVDPFDQRVAVLNMRAPSEEVLEEHPLRSD